MECLIDLDVVSTEVIAAVALRLFPETPPRKLQLKLPMRVEPGEFIEGEFRVVSEFGTRELTLTTIAKSEGQLVNVLVQMIEHGLDVLEDS